MRMCDRLFTTRRVCPRTSGETSQNTPNHTWINWRPIRDFCSRGARVAPWYTSEGLLGGLKQEQRSNYPKNWNCHGGAQCTRCKSKKSGFRLKLRIKKLSPRTIWQKSQKEFFYLWLNCNMKTVHLDWLQDCPIGFAKGTLQKLNFKINHRNWVFGLKKSLLSVVLMKKGPHNNLFSYSRKVWLEVLEMRHNTSLILSESLFQRVFFAGKIGDKRSHLEIFVWTKFFISISHGWWWSFSTLEKNISHLCTLITSKRIELESPGCSGFKAH